MYDRHLIEKAQGWIEFYIIPPVEIEISNKWELFTQRILNTVLNDKFYILGFHDFPKDLFLDDFGEI